MCNYLSTVLKRIFFILGLPFVILLWLPCWAITGYDLMEPWFSLYDELSSR